MRVDHPADRLQRLHGLALLDEADDGVDDHDTQDDRRVDEVIEKQRQSRRGQQRVDEQIVKLGQQSPESTPLRRLRQAVRPVGPQALVGLRLAEPVQSGPHPLDGRFRGQGMPGLRGCEWLRQAVTRHG